MVQGWDPNNPGGGQPGAPQQPGQQPQQGQPLFEGQETVVLTQEQLLDLQQQQQNTAQQQAQQQQGLDVGVFFPQRFMQQLVRHRA